MENTQVHVAKEDGRRRPRSLETKKNIAEGNKIAVRGVKLMKDKEVKKVTYKDIVKHLEDGWIFKSQKVYMNKNGKSMHKLTSTWEKWINLGWTWGSLSSDNLKTCIKCGCRDKYTVIDNQVCEKGGSCE